MLRWLLVVDFVLLKVMKVVCVVLVVELVQMAMNMVVALRLILLDLVVMVGFVARWPCYMGVVVEVFLLLHRLQWPRGVVVVLVWVEWL